MRIAVVLLALGLVGAPAAAEEGGVEEPRLEITATGRLHHALEEGVPKVGRSSTLTRLEDNMMMRTEVVHSRLGLAELLESYANILEGEGWERITAVAREQVAWSVHRMSSQDSEWLATMTISGPPEGEPPYGVRFVAITALLQHWVDFR